MPEGLISIRSNPNRIWWSGDTSSHLGYIEVLDQ